MKLVIGSDHAGFLLKEYVKDELSKRYTCTDVGTYSTESVDYPDFAHLVAIQIEDKEADYGILICGSGQGVCMTANKHAGVRAALVWNSDLAKLSRQHNNANIICLAARFTAKEYALQMIEDFIIELFEGGRHEKRLDKINTIK